MKFKEYLQMKMKELDKEYDKYLWFSESPNHYGLSEDYFDKRLNEIRLQRWMLDDIINEYNNLESKGE